MERLDLFSSSQWAQLIARSSKISQEVASISTRRRRREAGSDSERRAARAEQFGGIGRIVSRQAGFGGRRNRTRQHENVHEGALPQALQG